MEIDRVKLRDELHSLGTLEASKSGGFQHVVVSNYRNLSRVAAILTGGEAYGYGSTIVAVWPGPKDGCTSILLREDWDREPGNDGL